MTHRVDRFGVDWRLRRVLVVGLGKSGLAASTFLAGLGCRVQVTDHSDEDATRQRAQQLRDVGLEGIELGGHTTQQLRGCEVVVVSPGVPESAVPLQWAMRQGVPIMSEIEVAFRFCRAPIIAVTGTNGKSSVVTLIQQVLTSARRSAIACGNVGIPFTQILPLVRTDTVVVLEVSSFQLMRCDTLHPAIGVLLNLGVNHLDRHRDRRSYIEAKARLFARQTPQDAAVLNGRDHEVVAVGGRLVSRRIWFGENRDNPEAFTLDRATCRLFPETWQAVLQVTRLAGVPDPLAVQVMKEFRGLEHRLEHLGTIRGVQIINDSKSTTPDSLLYALQRCRDGIVPILGGRDKGMDFDVLKDALAQKRIRGLVLLGEARHRLRTLFNGTPPSRECHSLQEAFEEAMALAHPGDTVLFSPACASFDMFRNFEERGRAFKQLVEQSRGQTAASAR